MEKLRTSKQIEYDIISEGGGRRQMPTGDILKLKKADYQVYAWLQANCMWGSRFANPDKKQDDEWNFIYKDACSSRHIAKYLYKTSYKTVERAIKNLQEIGLIEDTTDNKGDEVWLLHKPENIQANNGNYYILVPAPLLRFLSNATNKNVIKLYCVIRAYTENGYRQSNETEYGWYYKNLQDMAFDIGLGKGKNAETAVADMITALEEFDLITVDRRPLYDKEGKIICKDKYFLQAKFQENYRVIDRSKHIYETQRKPRKEDK